MFYLKKYHVGIFWVEIKLTPFSIHTHNIYIYIYTCVCMCVCVCVYGTIIWKPILEGVYIIMTFSPE